LDLLTIALMLTAALLHAGWHSLVKSGADQTVTLAGMGMVAATLACAALPFVPAPSAAVWLVLATSVALHVGYKLCLAHAYRHGDLGEAFPLARGMVPLFATVSALVTLGQVPTAGQALGIAAVSAGLVIVLLERQRSANWRLLAGAAGAGLAVAGYSVLDAYGIRLLGDWMGFTAWLVVLDSATFLAMSRLQRGASLWRDLMRSRGRILASGVLGLASFCVFLWALGRGPVGAVSALRETSTLFAIAIGVAFYRERLSAARLAGASLMMAGVVGIALAAK
jgi:drug/metabolite transporter (DMT)-like permease